MDFYGTTRFSQNFLVLSICLAVGWIFGKKFHSLKYIFEFSNDLIFLSGADNVVNIIEDMTGQRPSIFFKMCWKYFTPLLLLVSQEAFLLQILSCLTQTLLRIFPLINLSGHLWFICGWLSSPPLRWPLRLPRLGLLTGMDHDAFLRTYDTTLGSWTDVLAKRNLQTGHFLTSYPLIIKMFRFLAHNRCRK